MDKINKTKNPKFRLSTDRRYLYSGNTIGTPTHETTSTTRHPRLHPCGDREAQIHREPNASDRRELGLRRSEDPHIRAHRTLHDQIR